MTQIENSHNTGNINGSVNAGGIAGSSSSIRSREAMIIDSYNTGKVSGMGCVGGIVGSNGTSKDASYPNGASPEQYASKSIVKGCYNTGEISGPSGYTGGLVGTSLLKSIIEDSWCVNEISVGSNPEMNFTKKSEEVTSVTVASSKDIATETAPTKKSDTANSTFTTTVAYTSHSVKQTQSSDEDSASQIIYGDVTGDGVVDINDLTAISLFLLGDESFDDKQFKAGNFDCNGQINLIELATLKQYIMKDDVKLGPVE